jgi:hypothetical protein
VLKSRGSFLIGQAGAVVDTEVRQRRTQLHVAPSDQPTEQGAND